MTTEVPERSAAAMMGGVLVVSSVQPVCVQESRDIPERYSPQVAPTPGTYWRSPDLRNYTRVRKSTRRSITPSEPSQVQ